MSIANNAKWVGISQFAKLGTQIASVAIFSRVLPASEFGLMAMAVTVTNFASLLRDMGTSAAVIQRPDLNEVLKSTIFSFNIFLGVLISICLAVLSPFIANWFRHQELVMVICTLSVIFPLTSVSALNQAMLERSSSFKILARIEIFSALLSLLIALLAVKLGAGVYALVVQAISLAVLSTVQLFLASRWLPKEWPSMLEFRGLWKFTGNLTAFNFINYISRNADGFIVGRYLGSFSLGHYSMACKLMLFPVQALNVVVNRALYPIMSRQQLDVGKTADLYLKTTGFIALVTAPLMTGLWVLRVPFVEFSLGTNWGVVAILLAWLAPSGFIQTIISNTSPVFMARGRTDILFYLGLIGALIFLSSFVIGVQWGLEVMVACYFFANLLNMFVCIACLRQQIVFSWLDFFKRLFVPILASLIMALLMSLVLRLFDYHNFNTIISMVLMPAVGLVTYVLMVRIISNASYRLLISLLKIF